MATDQFTLPLTVSQSAETKAERKRRLDHEWEHRNRDRHNASNRARRAADPGKERRARQRKRASMSPEELADYREKNAIRMRLRYAEGLAEGAAWLEKHQKDHRERARRERLLNPIKTKENDRRASAIKLSRQKDVPGSQYLIRMRLRQRIRLSLQRFMNSTDKPARPGSAVRDLGCSILEFRAYIEALFQPGMEWKNWGRKGWHLDHIRPLASFDLTDREQFLVACHYTNYQPLWWRDNILKGARMVPTEASTIL